MGRKFDKFQGGHLNLQIPSWPSNRNTFCLVAKLQFLFTVLILNDSCAYFMN